MTNLSGYWKALSWNSKISEIVDEEFDKILVGPILSKMNVWETDKYYSAIYSDLFSRKIKSESDFKNYLFQFIDHGINAYTIEVYDIRDKTSVGSLNFSFPEDYESYEYDLELQVGDYSYRGKFEILPSGFLQLTEVVMGTKFLEETEFEVSFHEIVLEKIDKNEITDLIQGIEQEKLRLEQLEYNEETPVYAKYNDGTMEKMTLQEMESEFFKAFRKTQKKWWHFWK